MGLSQRRQRKGRNSCSSLPCWGLEPGRSTEGRPDWFLEWCVPVAHSCPASWMHQHKLRHEIKAVSLYWGGMAMFWIFHCKDFGKLLLLIYETCLFCASARLGVTFVWLSSDINIYKQVNISGAATYPYCMLHVHEPTNDAHSLTQEEECAWNMCVDNKLTNDYIKKVKIKFRDVVLLMRALQWLERTSGSFNYAVQATVCHHQSLYSLRNKPAVHVFNPQTLLL